MVKKNKENYQQIGKNRNLHTLSIDTASDPFQIYLIKRFFGVSPHRLVFPVNFYHLRRLHVEQATLLNHLMATFLASW